MHRVFGGAVLFILLAVLAFPVATSAATQSVTGQQITITAAVKPSRFVVVDSFGTIQQIISNNSTKNLEPEVYITKVAPENLIETTTQIRNETEELLADKKIKPGVLYDRKREPLVVKKLDFIELLNNRDKSITVSHRLMQ